MEFYFHELDRSLLILCADGGLNADTATEFVQQLESLIKSGSKQIIIDCTNLNYISSYGVGMLLRIHKKLARHGGDVKIAAPQSRVLQVLTLLRMGQVFQIYGDVNAARLAFRQPDQASNESK